MKILLVDDDAFLRDMYATKFVQGGHEVDVAKSVEYAIEALQKDNFDVVLLDMVMPGYSGIDLLKKIHTEKLGGEPMCIVLSNQGEKTDIDAAMNEGAAGYIVKAAMIPSEVVDKVTSLVKNKK